MKFKDDMLKVQKGNTLIKQHPKEKDFFVVIHTAKNVDYKVNDFVVKNMDSITDELTNVMKGSKNNDFIEIFNIFETLDAGGADDKFLGSKFRSQIYDLINELESSQCHFVRCLKPNEAKKPAIFWQGMVMNQIKYLGIQDSIKVKKSGYPTRFKFE